MEVILVRHTSVDVPPGTCYGQTDVALRSTFSEEAEAVYRRLAGYAPFDRVYTSPLSRCIRLAEYGGYADAVRDSRLLELNFGAWEMQRDRMVCRLPVCACHRGRILCRAIAACILLFG